MAINPDAAVNATGGPTIPPGLDLSENQQGELRIILWAITALATLFVILRFLARIKRQRVGMDDYMLLVSLAVLFSLCWVNLTMIHHGLGRHAAALTPAQLTEFLKYLAVQEIVYAITNGLIKVAVLTMYCRIFTFHKIKWPVLVTGFMSVGWTVAIIPTTVFQCNPIEKAWNPFMPGSCIKLREAFIATGALNILTDSLILCIPIPLVWNLHTNLLRRLSLIFIFSLGSFVVFASIYRFSTIFKFNPMDITWTLARACVWCVAECAAGIISCCLPTLRPLFLVVFSGLRTSNNESKPTDIATIGGSGGGGLQKFQKINDRSLRPHYDNTLMSSIVRTRSDHESGDEVLLNVINVRTEVEWSESSPASAAGKGV